MPIRRSEGRTTETNEYIDYFIMLRKKTPAIENPISTDQEKLNGLQLLLQSLIIEEQRIGEQLAQYNYVDKQAAGITLSKSSLEAQLGRIWRDKGRIWGKIQAIKVELKESEEQPSLRNFYNYGIYDTEQEVIEVGIQVGRKTSALRLPL